MFLLFVGIKKHTHKNLRYLYLVVYDIFFEQMKYLLVSYQYFLIKQQLKKQDKFIEVIT